MNVYDITQANLRLPADASTHPFEDAKEKLNQFLGLADAGRSLKSTG
jgi:hypothetical protein